MYEPEEEWFRWQLRGDTAWAYHAREYTWVREQLEPWQHWHDIEDVESWMETTFGAHGLPVVYSQCV